jgi:putative transposase
VVMKRQSPTPRLRVADRCFWVCLLRVWPNWRKSLLLVRPGPGFPGESDWDGRERGVNSGIWCARWQRPIFGAPRIHGELLKLGIDMSERTVSQLMPKRRKPPSQTWQTFLENHVSELVSIDFFTVPTATFRVLFVLIVLAHHRRRVLHFNVTEHPTPWWTGQQVMEAFPEDTTPRYLLRDRDKVYGREFRQRIQSLNIEEVLSAPASPWQRAYVER